MIAIQVRKNIGLGDALQFTSVPENYYRHTGKKLVDLEHHPVFDHNPFVKRLTGDAVPDASLDLWNLHCLDVPLSFKNRTTFLSNAEAHSRHFQYPVILNRPRLYHYEDYPFTSRRKILLHVKGRSHGQLPEHVVRHVMQKYYGENLYWIAADESEWTYPFKPPRRLPTPTFWDLAREVSKARLFIGPDSGPAWVARCYPDVDVKIVRLIPSVEALHDWVPLECCRIGSHWDDRSAKIYNVSEDDAGITWSYRRI